MSLLPRLGALLWLRNKDGEMQEKPSKGADGSGRDRQPRGASQTAWLACGVFLCLFFPPTSMFTDSKDSKEVHFWLRPRWQFSAGSVSFPGT